MTLNSENLPSIEDEVLEALREHNESATDRRGLIELQAFYEAMLEKGLVIKRPYDLPLVDTIGHLSGSSDLHVRQ